MSRLWILGPVLLLQVISTVSGEPAIIKVVENYNDATTDVKELIDKVVDHCSAYSVLQLTKHIPMIDNEAKCVESKKAYIKTLKQLLEQTNIQEPKRGDLILVETKEGPLKMPYLVEIPGESVTCEKDVNIDVMQMAFKKQVAANYGKMLSVMNTANAAALKEELLKNPNVIMLTSVLAENVNTLRTVLDPQAKQLLGVLSKQAENINNFAQSVAQNPQVQEYTKKIQGYAETLAQHPQVQQYSNQIQSWTSSMTQYEPFKIFAKWGASWGIPGFSTGDTKSADSTPDEKEG